MNCGKYVDTRILFLFHITYYVTFPGSRAPTRIGGPFAITSRVLRASDSHILFSWVGFFVLFGCKISPKKQLIRTSERNLSSLVLNALTFALRARRTNRWHAYLVVVLLPCVHPAEKTGLWTCAHSCICPLSISFANYVGI